MCRLGHTVREGVNQDLLLAERRFSTRNPLALKRHLVCVLKYFSFLFPKARRAQKLIFLLKKYYGLKQFFKLRIFRFPKRNFVESRILLDGLCLQRQGQCTTGVKKYLCEERGQCGQKPKSH